MAEFCSSFNSCRIGSLVAVGGDHNWKDRSLMSVVRNRFSALAIRILVPGRMDLDRTHILGHHYHRNLRRQRRLG